MSKWHRLGSSRRDLAALLVLGTAVIVLFIPALTGRLGIFHDDQAMAEFPWHFFLARNFQSGDIPLWEPDTWCGAIPFYARYYADTFYFPLWPFYLLTDLQDLDSAYWTLTLLPLLVHYLLGTAGMYVFARSAMRLGKAGAFICAWVYVFSPAFSYSYVWFPIVAVQAWLPWFLLAIAAMNRGVGFWRIAAGGVTFALMVLAAQPPHAGYGLLLGALLALSLGSGHLQGKNKCRFFRAPLQLSGAVLLGLGLSAVFWLSALDGSAHTEHHLPSTYEAMTGQDGSMPPIYLATLFVPDLFGTVSGFNGHNWVESVTHGVRFWDANMGGGLLLIFLALTGLSWASRQTANRSRRRWALFAGGIWVFSILCMLGRHTPFYGLFWRWVPGLSLFPFPIRYRLLEVIATAWLAGLGMDWLAGRGRQRRPAAGLVWGYLGLGALAVLAALAGRQGLAKLGTGTIALPGLTEILERDQLKWFVGGPIFCFLAGAFCLVLAWRGFRGRGRAVLVGALVMAETGIIASAAFYFCIFRFHEPQPQQLRSLRPSLHPMVQRVLGPLSILRKDQTLRWATDQPFHDNFARLDPQGSWALLGYDMKPLDKRFKQAFEDAYERPVDWPLYWEYPRPKSPAFMSNMSVGWLLDSRKDNPFPGGSTVQLEADPAFFLHHNPRALPRAFTLDRLIPATTQEALEQLTGGDLRKAVLVEKKGQFLPALQGIEVFEKVELIPENREGEDYFAAFQAANPVTFLDLSNPNRIDVNVELLKPAMLILTETWYPGWEANIDGKPAPILRANYLQRAIPVPAGKHRVEMVFLPRTWRIGATVSLISWTGLVLFLGTVRIKRKIANKRTRVKMP